MTIKESAIRAIQDLPEEASWEDIQERLHFVEGVLRGLNELETGLGIPHEDLRREILEWVGD